MYPFLNQGECLIMGILNEIRAHLPSANDIFLIRLKEVPGSEQLFKEGKTVEERVDKAIRYLEIFEHLKKGEVEKAKALQGSKVRELEFYENHWSNKLVESLIKQGFSIQIPLQDVQMRIELQSKFPRVNGWCMAPYLGETYCGTIHAIEGTKATVTLFKTDLPYSDWPTLQLEISTLQQRKADCFDTLPALVANLKNQHFFHSNSIEEALFAVDRAWFSPNSPYFDTGIVIPHGMYISAPHIQVLSLELCSDLLPRARAILDAGSGSGYMAALFAHLAPDAEVTGIEYHQDLVDSSRKVIQEHLHGSHIEIIQGDALKPKGSYDIIYVGFMTPQVPKTLLDSLRVGGKLIIPIGSKLSSFMNNCLSGHLTVVEKIGPEKFRETKLFSCSFVPSVFRTL